MTTKGGIIDALGETALLLPSQIVSGLEANDRAKYCFTLLQTAASQADRPDLALPDLAIDRRACGIDEAALDQAVSLSRRVADDSYRIPGAEALFARVRAALERMLLPLATAQAAGLGPDRAAIDGYRRRLAELLAAAPTIGDDTVPADAIRSMVRLDPAGGDSHHRLVADLHKALNRLQAEMAQESIDGASAHGLDEPDRPLVRAFMRGLRATAPLKFDHPGLDTHATRSGDRLIIQNDIGTTDAHVLVIHVREQTVVLTYTDVHIQRAQFFQTLFEAFEVRWDDTRSRRVAGLEESDLYYLCAGTFAAASPAELERYLAFLGSRIVFLIDWNRARKRLRQFLPKRDTIRLLRWAADHDFGHRAFLELGGEGLIYDAIDYAAPAPPHYGQRLDELLGVERTSEYLRFVLETASEGLRAGRSARLLRDELKAELLNYFHTAQQGLRELLARHASLVLEIACGVRDGLLHEPGAAGRRYTRRSAERAAHWETRADAVLERTRAAVGRSSGTEVYARIARHTDAAADSLEDAAFLVALLYEQGCARKAQQPLRDLSDLLVGAGRELVKCIESAGYVHRGGAREDRQDFLEAVDRLLTLEHETDRLQRAVTVAVLGDDVDHKRVHLITEIARGLEEAADRLLQSALLLRDHTLEEVMAR